jgi:hypothetical protein
MSYEVSDKEWALEGKRLEEMWKNIDPITGDYLDSDDIIGAGKDFDAAVSALLVGIEAKYNKLFPTHAHKMTLSLAAGSKFVKVIEGGSVWGFVGKRDGSHKGIPFKQGDVFKAASWNAPAKHVRGSIFDENNSWYAWTGPNYL